MMRIPLMVVLVLCVASVNAVIAVYLIEPATGMNWTGHAYALAGGMLLGWYLDRIVAWILREPR